ncbi:MAG: peroxiredoxin [Sulfolobaceae archaeon]|nr:peroxiredoxin [Sulfolobaceae archaeon]
MLKLGIKAPDFEAVDDNGNKFRLYDYVKKFHVVLYFYPKDDTPGCTREACSFRDSWNRLSKYNAAVIGVSSDPPESHRKFKQKYNLPFILVSDVDKKIRKLYDAEGFILPSRITYVISKEEGIIVHAYNSQFSPERHVDEAIKALEKLTSK